MRMISRINSGSFSSDFSWCESWVVPDIYSYSWAGEICWSTSWSEGRSLSRLVGSTFWSVSWAGDI